MTVDATTATSGTGLYTSTTATSDAKKELDNETFLTLLVAQLKYQDPSSPMDTTQMMAQTTQLASMEQLTTLTTTMSESFALQMRVAAANLIGQEVTYTNAEGETVTGVASSVSYKNSVPSVTVDGEDVVLDAISTVKQPASTTTAPAGATAPTTAA